MLNKTTIFNKNFLKMTKKKQMNLFKISVIETDLWSKNSGDKIISYKK